MSVKLELIFVNQAGKKVYLRLDNPLETLAEADVKNVMDTIIAKNIFTSSGGDLINVAGARIVSRDVTELDVLNA
ncbi:MAG: DUF2922 domain-containing protein [Desulfotomaculum sp.]|nr:DUF2922 domain-containing protein [Desulfotomaculum sp.]